ncbi:MAG: hypothetical protein ABIH83_03655 [Candidatus Micrarchaeota archaeon]
MQKNIFILTIAILSLSLFAGDYFPEALEIEILSPPDGYMLNNISGENWTEITAVFKINASIDEWNCVLFVDDIQVEGTAKEFEELEGGELSLSIPRELIDEKGFHPWNIQCTKDEHNITSHMQTIFSGNVPTVELVSPAHELKTKNTTIEFQFIYHKTDFGRNVSECYINVRGNERGPLQLPDGETGIIEIINIPKGVFYPWYVTCDGFQSDTWIIAVEPDKFNNITILSPKENETINYSNPRFVFIYQNGDWAPEEANCKLIINSLIQNHSTITNNGKLASIDTWEADEERQYYWFIECYTTDTDRAILQSKEITFNITASFSKQQKPLKELYPEYFPTPSSNPPAPPAPISPIKEGEEFNLQMATAVLIVLVGIVIALGYLMLGHKKTKIGKTEIKKEPKKAEKGKKKKGKK